MHRGKNLFIAAATILSVGFCPSLAQSGWMADAVERKGGNTEIVSVIREIEGRKWRLEDGEAGSGSPLIGTAGLLQSTGVGTNLKSTSAWKFVFTHLTGSWENCISFEKGDTFKVVKTFNFDMVAIEYFKSLDKICDRVAQERAYAYNYYYLMTDYEPREDGAWVVVLVGANRIPSETPIAFYELLSIRDGKLYSSDQLYAESPEELSGFSDSGFTVKSRQADMPEM